MGHGVSYDIQNAENSISLSISALSFHFQSHKEYYRAGADFTKLRSTVRSRSAPVLSYGNAIVNRLCLDGYILQHSEFKSNR